MSTEDQHVARADPVRHNLAEWDVRGDGDLLLVVMT